MAERWYPYGPNAMEPTGLYALGLAHPSQPEFDDWRRAAAWTPKAGHVDRPSAYDHNGNWLRRNAKQGEYGCWHAAHIDADCLGGPDVASNYSSDNMAEGGILGNWMRH